MERLLDFFIPKSYKLSLSIDKHAKFLSGNVKIEGKTKSSGLVKLHSVGQTIDFVKINDEKVDFSLENCVLTAVAPALSVVSVEVGFHGPLNENMQGAYLSTYSLDGKEERIVSTQFESHYARECFPCVDEPAAKATFDLVIAVPDKDDIVLSNMEVSASNRFLPAQHGAHDRMLNASGPEGRLEDGTEPRRVLEPDTRNDGMAGLASRDDLRAKASWYSWHFKQTPRMSTYLLAFAIGKFNCLEKKTKSGILVRTFAPLDKDKSLLKFPNDVAVKALDFYENLFKTPYPLKKLDQVAIPDFEAGAMENWGLVTYRESQLLCSESSSLASKKSVALTVTHELSHQWFGNLVTMKWWNDLWLNESFATIMEYYCTDFCFSKYKVWNDFFTSDCLAALYRDAISGVQAVREDVSDPAEIATLFDPCIVYAKGAHLMLMLIREMGEENFFTGLKAYFEKNKYKNTDANDLWASLEPFAKGFSVRDFMTAWLTEPGYPVVTDEAQQRFLLDGSTDDKKYPIPEVRNDMSGHYLINLSGPEFDEALENFKNLSTEERLRLLIDRMLLAETPIVSSASLLPLIAKFKDETSAPVWEIIDGIISKLTLFIDYDSPEEEKYKAYLYSLVEKPLKKLGLEPKPGESLNDNELRQTLLSVAVYSKNPELLENLASPYSSDLRSLDADLRPFILTAKMWLEEKTFFPEVLAAYKTETDPDVKSDLRSALGKPRLKENLDLAFSFLKDSDLIKPQDHLSFLLRLRRWKFSRDRALDWLFENWDYIYKINGEKSIEDYPRYFASTIDKREESDRFFEFFTPMSDNPVLARTLKVAKNDIDSTLKLIEADKAAVLRAIRKLS
ncbi:M1 family metallopeptidase [Candidatus Saccharibacteria bacterium]|nr:M1 family metallopeptidase [Candidatus Saccharibacteria bacterium]